MTEAIITKSPLSEVLQHWKSNCLQGTKTRESIRSDAKTFFKYLVNNTQIVTENNVILKTNSSHEEALAKLIQELGEPLSFSHKSRVYALHTLCGAIEGCKESTLSNGTIQLISTFLVNHCGPIVDDGDEGDDNDYNDNEDYTQFIRDAAILALTALVRIGCDDNTNMNDTTIVEALKIRITTTKNALERRCAVAESQNNDNNYDYGLPSSSSTTNNTTSFRGGLSTLPRSKRSMCFELLQACMDGISKIVLQQEKNQNQMAPSAHLRREIQPDLVLFATRTTISCIHGESDPRCLMQLLKLFHKLQTSLQPLFESVSKTNLLFPTMELFDAVAPYYPIQFTPPPNDIYGITREGLSSVLLSILCYFGYDDNARKFNHHTMLDLSVGLMLEQFQPVAPDESPIPTMDKLEAIDNLSNLLFPKNNDKNNNQQQQQQECNTSELLSENTVKTLSTSLKHLHDESSMGVAQGGQEGTNCKELADKCRTIIAKLALVFEKAKNKSLWNIFVSDSLQTQSSSILLQKSPSKATTLIAYIACLASCGGPRTLRCCLETSLNPLIDSIENANKALQQNNDDNSENGAAAAYGIGAFFSSARVAMDRARNDGIELHPHPLYLFSSRAFRSLYKIIIMGNDTEESGETTHSAVAVRIAAIRAMESVLLSAPLNQFSQGDKNNTNESDVSKIITFIGTMTDSVTSIGMVDDDAMAWRRACSETVGRILGKSLASSTTKEEKEDNDKNTESLSCVLQTQTITNTNLTTILPQIISSANKQREVKSDKDRCDRQALSIACSSSREASDVIFTVQFTSLKDALQSTTSGATSLSSSSSSPTTLACAAALSHILRHGGDLAIQSFFFVMSPQDILSHLTGLGESISTKRTSDIMSSFNDLSLPASAEERHAVDDVIQSAQKIVMYLLPAYNKWVPRDQVMDLAKQVSMVVPPLSSEDYIKVSVLLPLLSTALGNARIVDAQYNNIDKKNDTALEEISLSMAPALAEFVLNLDNRTNTRLYATTCLHAVLRFGDNKGRPCPILPIFVDSLCSNLVSSIDTLKKMKKKADNNSVDDTILGAVSTVYECFKLLGILASAAISRGGKSSITGDKIALFLIQLICTKKATLPFTKDGTNIIDITSPGTNNNDDNNNASPFTTLVELCASTAYGIILSMETGSPLTRQRVTHITLKLYMQLTESSSSNSSFANSSMGQLLTCCHIVSCRNLVQIDRTAMFHLAKTIVDGLHYIFAPEQQEEISYYLAGSNNSNGDNSNWSVPNLLTVKTLVVASMIKLICVVPRVLLDHVSVVTGLLRAYASSDPQSELSCKLLALQALESMAHVDGIRETVSTVKPAVISILAAAINHPSVLLRQAAVDVRNAWFVLD